MFRPHGQGDRHKEYNRFGRDKALLALYSGAPWRKFRAWIKAERILCEACRGKGLTVPGEHVHHIRDPRDAPELVYEQSNVVLLCLSCHSARHAARETRGTHRKGQ
jgi:hypothetical protein